MEQTETKTYKISSLSMYKFEANLEKINKKARKLGLPLVGYTEISREHVPAKDYYEVMGTDEYAHPAFDIITVILCGDVPYISGWSLVGVLEHTPDFDLPLIHAVPGSKVPHVYWSDKSKTCDHCGAIRNRKDTFIIQNVETKEYQQIGRQCIADFLPGMTPEQALKYSEHYRSIGACLGDEDYCDMDFSNAIQWDHAEYDVVDVLALAGAVIRKDGWLSATQAKSEYGGVSTSDSVKRLLNPQTRYMGEKEKREFEAWAAARKPVEGDKETATKALEWLKSDDFSATTEYGHNLKQIANKGASNYRNLAITVSALPSYFKFVDRQKELVKDKEVRVNEWVGKEKDRLRDMTLEVYSVRYLESNFGTTTFINFRDTVGRTFTWFASGSLEMWRGEKYKVTGTVKKLDTYNGFKQTVLTRCKLEKIEDAKPETQEVAASA